MHAHLVLAVTLASLSSFGRAAGPPSALSPCLDVCIFEANKAFGCRSGDIACQCDSPDWRPAVITCAQPRCGTQESLVFIETDLIGCKRPIGSMNDAWRAQLIAIVVGVYILLALRLLSRYATMWWDDWLHVCSMVVFTATLPFQFLGIKAGLGYHAWTSKGLIGLPEILKNAYLGTALHITAASLLKISVLCLYLRLFPGKNTRLATKGGIVLTALTNTALIITLLLSCLPVSAFWDITITDKKCLNLSKLADAQTGFNLALEIFIILLPLPSIYILQMHWQKRLGVASIFAVGIVVIAVAAYRIPANRHLQDYADLSYNYAKLIAIAHWEILASYFCATAPALRGLIRIIDERYGSKLGNLKVCCGGNRRKQEGSSGRDKVSLKSMGGMRTVDTAILGERGEDAIVPGTGSVDRLVANDDGSYRFTKSYDQQVRQVYEHV